MTDPVFAQTLVRLTNPLSEYGRAIIATATLDLSVGEARFPLPRTVRAELGAAVEDLTRIWYADPTGDPELRGAYLRHLSAQPLASQLDIAPAGDPREISGQGAPAAPGASRSPDSPILNQGAESDLGPDIQRVLVTGGGKEAAWLAIRYLAHRAASAGEGTGVLLPCPGWEPYRLWVNAIGCSQVTYDPIALAADPFLLRRIVDESPLPLSTMIINYPHNPTGTSIDQATMNTLVTIADDLGLAVVSDEVYREFAPGRVSACHAPRYDPVRHLVVDSCSKWLTVAGLRVGFLVAAPSIVRDLTLFRASYASCTSTLTQRVALTLLSSRAAAAWLESIRQEVQDTRQATALHLADRGVRVTSQGGLYLWCRTTGPGRLTPPAIGGVRAALTPGTGFGADDHFRVCPARAGLDPAAAADAIVTALEAC